MSPRARGRTVRLIDLAFVLKDADGLISITEVADQDVALAYRDLADPRFDLVSETDLSGLAAALRPGSSALVVAWENSWAARFAAAVGQSRGRVMAFDRVPSTAFRRALSAGQ